MPDDDIWQNAIDNVAEGMGISRAEASRIMGSAKARLMAEEKQSREEDADGLGGEDETDRLARTFRIPEEAARLMNAMGRKMRRGLAKAKSQNTALSEEELKQIVGEDVDIPQDVLDLLDEGED